VPRGSAPPHGARSLWEYVADTHGTLEVPLDARRLVQPPLYAAAPPPRLGRPAAVAAASCARRARRRSLAECRHERGHLWPLMTLPRWLETAPSTSTNLEHLEHLECGTGVHDAGKVIGRLSRTHRRAAASRMRTQKTYAVRSRMRDVTFSRSTARSRRESPYCLQLCFVLPLGGHGRSKEVGGLIRVLHASPWPSCRRSDRCSHLSSQSAVRG
jgi:hypothetical protein